MKKKGFTLVELVMTCVIVAILAAMITPKFVRSIEFWKLRTEARKIAADLRQLQQRSRKYPSRYYGIQFNGNSTSYDVIYYDRVGPSWNNTGENVEVKSGLKLQVLQCWSPPTPVSPYRLVFDSLGAPKVYTGPGDPEDGKCYVTVINPALGFVGNGDFIVFSKYTGRMRLWI